MMPTPRDTTDQNSWVPAIWPDDLEHTLGQWTTLTVEKKQIHFEFRSKKPWNGVHTRKESSTDYTWILCSAYPELSETGDLLYCTGVLTEISEQKWIQGDSLRRAKQADDAKRQQVGFTVHKEHAV